MQLEIRHARVVVTVAEAGSISKAAVQLGLPQPSLTAQLRRIEQTIGGDLFVRSSTGITPTRLGRRLVPMFADLAVRADAVLAEATAETSTLRFGIAEWTPATLSAAMRDSLPGREVRTVTLASTAVLAEVSNGQLNVALVSSPETIAPLLAKGSGLAKETVVTEPVWVAVPAGSAAAGRPMAGYADLAKYRWVRHVPEHWLHHVEQRLFRQHDFRPEVLHQVAGHAEAMRWVRDAGATTLVTPSGWNDDVGLVPIDKAQHSELMLVWRAGSLHHETVQTLTDALRRYYVEYARQVPTLLPWARAHPAEFPQLPELATG